MSVSDVPSGLKTLEPHAPEIDPHHSKRRARALFEPAIVRRAILDSFVKLDPRLQAKNPVMFIVEVGSVLTTFLFFRDLSRTSAATNWFTGLVAAFLWFTVLFANFAEAMAEGRGKAQAETLRKTRAETVAYVRQPDGSLVETPSSQLQVGDLCVVRPGQVIPGDGDVVEGIASVDESAITGESAPVIRESGGDRCAVTGGTRVLSDEIVVKITSKPGETFLDRMIALVEGAERQKTPNEIALNILLAGLTLVFMLAVVTLQPFAIYSAAPQSIVVLVALLVCLIPTTIGALLSAIGIAGMDRLVQRNVLGDERPRGRGGRRLLDAAVGQDRHDHARQPPGRRVPAGAGRRRSDARRGGAALQPGRRDPRRSLDRRAREGPLRSARARARPTPSSCPSPRRPACRASTSPAASFARARPTRCSGGSPRKVVSFPRRSSRSSSASRAAAARRSSWPRTDASSA